MVGPRHLDSSVVLRKPTCAKPGHPASGVCFTIDTCPASSMPLALRGEAVSRAWLSDRHQRGPGRRYRRLPAPRHVPLQPRGLPLQETRRETCTAGWRVTRDGIVPSGEIVERSGAIEFGDGAGRAISGGMGGSLAGTGCPGSRPGCPRRPLQIVISRRKRHRASREPSPPELAEPARHEICRNFVSTRLALCERGRMMAVFRFQRRCRSALKTESDEDVAPIGNISRLP